MNKTTLSIGLAMFSMFFGAGNIIFPLALGQMALDQNLTAFAGLLISAVLIPFAGVFGMILFEGNTKEFFGRLGKIPGLLLALLVITLLGPCGSTPRCIALTYGTVKNYVHIPLVLFNLLACGVVFFFAYQKNRMLAFLGTYLTPFLLASLAFIVISGFLIEGSFPSTDFSAVSIFSRGLKEGYNTMDLLAAFFFSSAIIGSLKESSYKNPLRLSMQASLIGAFLLAIVYLGFSTLAAMHAADLQVGKEELLCALANRFAGPYAGSIVCITIALACLTTAIALISVFSDFISKLIHLSYEKTLLLSLILTFFVSTFEFNGISHFLGPVLEIFYPGLIVLTILNILYKLFNLKIVKGPVFLTFVYSTILHLIS